MRFDPQLAATFSNAQDERELGQAMLAVVDRLGATFFQVLRFASTEHGKAIDEMGSYTDALVNTFNQEYPDACDPVMQHLRCSSTPILWDKEYYTSGNHDDRRAYEVLADFGVGFGASFASHVGSFRHLTLEVAWPHHVSPDPRLLMDLQLYAVHAEPAYYRIWSRSELVALQPTEPITERELQTLYWASRGYKIPAIAAMHDRSKRTFEKFAQDVTAKLGAATLTEAVSIAERLQLFDELRSKEAAGRLPRRWRY